MDNIGCFYIFFIQAYNGILDTSPMIGDKICGDVTPDPIQSSGNTLKVKFFTDRSVTSRGFSASYHSNEASGKWVNIQVNAIIMWCNIIRVMHELPWITIFRSLVKVFGKSPHKWPKNCYSWQRMYYFISYSLFDVLNTPFHYKQSSIAHFAIDAKDSVFWINIVTSCETRGTGIVTSYLLIVLARANWRKGDLPSE